jgi:hypothetical protein
MTTTPFADRLSELARQTAASARSASDSNDTRAVLVTSLAALRQLEREYPERSAFEVEVAEYFRERMRELLEILPQVRRSAAQYN